MVTAGCISDAKEALALCSLHKDLYLTVGCHPTRCNEYAKAGATVYEEQLLALIAAGGEQVVAVG